MRYLDQIRELEKQAAAHRDQVKGGLADQKQPKELPQDQLNMGEKVEREHTKDKATAKEIAMDHLVEDKHYYTKLRRMEKKASLPPCRRCGNTTRDQRGGICDRCAFRAKEKKAMLESFVDELEKMAGELKVDEATLRSEMTQLAGQASLAWTPQPSTQVFDAEAALRAVDSTMSRLKTKTARKLTTKARKKLPAQAFVFPKEKRYPIHDASHARNALARASGKPEEPKVRAAVHRRFPGIGSEKTAGWVGRKLEEAGKSIASSTSTELARKARKYLPHAMVAGAALPVAVGAASYYGSKKGVQSALRQPEQEKTAVSLQWVRKNVGNAAKKANRPFNLLGREKVQDFADRVVRKGTTVAQRDKRHLAGVVANKALTSNRMPLKAATITKTAGKRAFSSVFRRAKREGPQHQEDETTVRPNLTFVERHPKAFYGSLAAAGLLGTGALIYRNREAAKKFVAGLKSEWSGPKPTTGTSLSKEEVGKAISHGVNKLMRHKKAIATNPPVPPPSMKTTKSPVTNVEISTAPKQYGSLGEKLLKTIQQGTGKVEPAKKLNRAMRRQLEHAARVADLNRRG